MTNLKSVTLTLATASFLVEGKTDKELLENAKIAMAEQLTNGQFPYITYGISDANALTIDKVSPGKIVESTEGRLGIVTGVNKNRMNVTYVNNISVLAPPENFKSSDATFEQARSKRSESYKKVDFWDMGLTGYFKNKGVIHEVVIGKITRGKAKVHVINSSETYSIQEKDLSHYIKDELSEVQ